MKIEETPIRDLLLIQPHVFGDSRGFFLETYHEKKFREANINVHFVQDNHSRSGKGVVRGLHFQKNYPQGKLVRVTRGAVYDVTVDIRKGSPTYKQWYGVELSEENYRQLWIPPNLAHGFHVLTESADCQYKVTDFYHPEDEYGIRWNDPSIGIDWQIDNPILSQKDEVFPSFDECEKLFPTYKLDFESG